MVNEKPKRTRTTRKTKVNTKPTSPQETVLDLTHINEEYKKVTEYSTYVADDNSNLVVKYNAVFDELEIQNLLTEAFTHLKYNDEQKLGYFNNYAEFMAYINFLIIKYFSSFKEQLKGSTLEQNILVMDKLSRGKYFKMFFEEIFDAEQVVKVYETLNERAELTDTVEKLQVELKQQLTESITDNAVRNHLNLQN